jgi:hypothetical protein
MNERIKDLAEQSELIKFKFGEQGGYATIEAVSDLNNLERFAELVDAAAVAREREKYAKLCEGLYSSGENNDKWTITRDMAIKDCVQAIRGRTE